MTHFDAATAAVEAALAAGARYADARVMHRQYESMSARNGEVEELTQDEDAGLGVRALVGSGWGFFAVPELDSASVRQAGARAAAIAAASSSVAGPTADLVPTEVSTASWRSECLVDPLAVALSDKGDLLVSTTREMYECGADQAEALYQIWDTRKWFVSSEGHRIDQHIRECGGGISATAIGEDETQRRSYPSYRGQYGTRGWELVTELDLAAHAARVADEARALLTAPPCPAGETDLILGSERADGWARLPMVRMTNVGLEPGPHTLEEIIVATDDGILMDCNRSWSIDDKRLNFQFGCEIGWEVKGGRRGRMLRNPTYTGIGPLFWRSLDMLSSETVAWGTPNCGKRQPGQVGHTGHPAAPGRFQGVRVGVRG